jgi:uncharacterized protein (DUF302 family)
MVDVLKKEVTYTFNKAVRRVEDVMRDEGFTPLLTKNIAEIFKNKLGLKDYPNYAFVLGCAAPLAKMALDISKDVGTLFPCSFVVYEENGKTIIAHTSIMRVAAEVGLASQKAMKPVIEETGKRIRKVWDRL